MDTIFALSSAQGRAGVAVLRLSGVRCAVAIQALTQRSLTPRMAHLCALHYKNEVFDHALVLWLPAPKSYTGEDMAEFHLHGSRAALSAFTEAMQSLGIRYAEAGEFTKRAVMNGKMDLTEAEAVADLVDAETEAQRRQALRQYSGALKDLYEGWRTSLTHVLAHLEAAIDFADDDLPPEMDAANNQKISTLLTHIDQHLSDGRRGERLRSGLFAAIIGAPNAGKSSLLNQLAQRDVAIVTPQAGTTRDVLEVQLDVGGYPLTLADTAGLRDAEDMVEKIGITRARKKAEEADFRLCLFDGSTQTVPDAATLALYQPHDILVINKADLPCAIDALQAALPTPALVLSTATGMGLDALLKAIEAQASALAGMGTHPTLTRARHRAALEDTASCLRRALAAPSADLRAEDVRLASRALGRITGKVGVEDLLDVIFRDFCLGK